MHLKAKSKLKNRQLTSESEISIINNLEIIDIDSITPWEKNPKKYKKKIKEIASSIRIYGQRTPVSVWRKNKKIYKGNNTWYAMKDLKLKKIAVVWQEFKDEREASAYALIDNTTGEDQEWDTGKLAALLQSDTFVGLDNTELSKITGFSDKNLKGFLLSTVEMPEVLPDVDLSGDVPDKADFIVIQFTNKEEMHAFKKRLGFKTKHPRVVPYSDLLKVMDWRNDTIITKKKLKFNLKKK